MGKHLVATGMQDDDAPIEVLDLSVRAYNCLKRSGINTVRQLLSLQKKEFLALRHMTPHAADEIRERLIERGFLDPMRPIGPFREDDEAQAHVFEEAAQPRRPLSIGAGAIVMHERRVLLVRSIYGVTKGRYLLPAGRVNMGELPDVAAARETFEETGLRVEIDGLLGIRLWVMDDGEHNYFFMFRGKLLSPIADLRPNLDEIDDARFFNREELQALGANETWAGAVAVALKALEPGASVWPNYADLSSDSGVDTPDRWRIWM